MSDLLRSNFGATMPAATPEDARQSERDAYKKRALESISGSMVFVEDALLYWDILENDE